MKQIIDYLEQLDLSEFEAKLYLTLLQNGHLSIRELAKKAGIKRTTAYLHIDHLIEKGLVTELIKGSRKYLAAQDLEENLKYLIEKKIQTAKTVQQEFTQIVQTIKESLPQVKPSTDAEIIYFKGKNAVKKIYEGAFNGKEIRSYVKVEETPELSPDNVVLFKNAFNKNKKLKMWEIIYESPRAQKKAQEIHLQSDRYFYKFMPGDLKWSITSEDILIYDGKVALINYKGKVSSVVLQSPDFYHNSKELFDFIWRMIPEV